jgi:hypothetical protein
MACRGFIAHTLQRLGLNVKQVKNVGRPSSGPSITFDRLRERE